MEENGVHLKSPFKRFERLEIGLFDMNQIVDIGYIWKGKPNVLIHYKYTSRLQKLGFWRFDTLFCFKTMRML